jgi:hypothetical protein
MLACFMKYHDELVWCVLHARRWYAALPARAVVFWRLDHHGVPAAAPHPPYPVTPPRSPSIRFARSRDATARSHICCNYIYPGQPATYLPISRIAVGHGVHAGFVPSCHASTSWRSLHGCQKRCTPLRMGSRRTFCGNGMNRILGAFVKSKRWSTASTILGRDQLLLLAARTVATYFACHNRLAAHTVTSSSAAPFGPAWLVSAACRLSTGSPKGLDAAVANCVGQGWLQAWVDM